MRIRRGIPDFSAGAAVVAATIAFCEPFGVLRVGGFFLARRGLVRLVADARDGTSRFPRLPFHYVKIAGEFGRHDIFCALLCSPRLRMVARRLAAHVAPRLIERGLALRRGTLNAGFASFVQLSTIERRVRRKSWLTPCQG